jgi:hypothetical protein
MKFTPISQKIQVYYIQKDVTFYMFWIYKIYNSQIVEDTLGFKMLYRFHKLAIATLSYWPKTEMEVFNRRLSLILFNHLTIKKIFTAIRHFVEMLGREPVLELLAGNVSVKMSAVEGGENGGPPLETDILPPELMDTNDEDIFGIGRQFERINGEILNLPKKYWKCRKDYNIFYLRPKNLKLIDLIKVHLLIIFWLKFNPF